ncbi:MAG: DUF2304 family protein [Patescibacteria group bacterium]|jgi:hypothetical protein|nr:DUF2304 domain-containing protein [Candidatus Moranbacteria bacterium]
MRFHIYQVVISVISAIMIYQGVTNYIKGKNNPTLLKLLARIAVWGSMALITIFPNISNVAAKIIGIEGNINAVILIGFIFVFLMMFKLLSAIEKLEQQLSEVTRSETLKEIKQK